MAVLIAVASRHGSTGAIAERIGARLRQRGHEVRVAAAEDVADVRPYEAVVIGSAVYYGRWLRPATELVRRQRQALEDRAVWLFSSGPVGDMPAQPVAVEGVQPREHRVFAGRLDRRQLGLAERLAARMVKAPEGDFRAWPDIDAWADSISSVLSTGRPALRR